MNNILKISAIAILAFVTHNSHATELVKAHAINTDELVEVAKLNIAQSIKFNTIAFNPIEKTAQAQVFGSDKTYPMELREISGEADPVSRTWKANYAFKPSDEMQQKVLSSLSLGQTAKLIFATNHSLIKVPNTALYEQADFASVWQVKDGKVLRVPVKVKSLSSRWAWVEGDFSGVKTIVSLGAHLLNDGEAVRESAE